MKLKDLLRIIRANAILVTLAAVFGGLATVGASLLVPSTYTAQSDLFVSVRTTGDPMQMQSASTFIQERMQTYVRMVDDRAVLEPVIEDLNLTVTPEELGERVTASSETGTVLISIEASADSADSAAKLSNAVSKSLVTAIERLETTADGQSGSLRLVVANPAVPPQSADGLGWWMSGILGLLLGFALGVGVSILLSVLDTRLRSKEDIEELTQVPILAAIPSDSDLRGGPLDVRKDPFSIAGESFRRLRTNLQFARIDDSNRALLVTSAQAGEGKTTTSINLAIAMAQKGQKVALVDVDLRSPAVAERLGLENAMGLTSALIGEADVADLLQPWGLDELYVLTAGDRPPNPTEILDSRAMARVLARLLDEFDSVVLDAPPTLPVADSLVIGRQVGRIVVVVGLGELRDRDLTETLKSLDVVGVPVSLVLNKVSPSTTQTAGYYTSYADTARPPIIDETIHPSMAGQGLSAAAEAETASLDTQPIQTIVTDTFGMAAASESSHQQHCNVGVGETSRFRSVASSDDFSRSELAGAPPQRGANETREKSGKHSRRQLLARERKQP